MVEYKVDLEDVELTLFELLDLRELAAIPRYAGQTVEEYRAVLREAASFARRDLAAVNEVGDRQGAAVVNGRVRMPEGFRDAWRKLCELGLLSVDLAPESGGLGLPALMYAAVTELVIGSNPSLSSFHLLAHEVARMLGVFGTAEQKERWARRLVSGEMTGTMCLTEPHAGSALGDVRAKAVEQAAREPETAGLVGKVHDAVERFAGAAQALAGRAAQDGAWAGLAATPFLRALGEILVAEALVRRAALAGRLLRGGDGRARFLQGKVEVARFHVTQLLPGADADIARVASDDRSALADVL